MKRLFIIANRLPVRAAFNEDKKPIFLEADGGLVSAIKGYLESSTHTYDALYWVGSLEQSFQARLINFKKKQRDLKYNLEAVFLEKNLYNTYYNGFCNSVIWPLFHYFPSFVEFKADCFAYYKKKMNIR